ncbi:MAG: hypothetical protein HYV63_08975 [Candidatus Schekmanbacteria bacterium]|nr:hypothetical protein [Candidatus Schekmanbacteria bacterium]
MSWRLKRALLASIVVVAGLSGSAAAKTLLDVTSATIYGYDEEKFFFNYVSPQTRQTLRQYLQMDVDGWAKGWISLHAYGSGMYEMADEGPQGRDQLDLLYGYASLHLDKDDRILLNAGRMFRLVPPLPSYFDGAQLAVDQGWLNLEVYGGWEVDPFHRTSTDIVLGGARSRFQVYDAITFGLSGFYSTRDSESDRGLAGVEGAVKLSEKVSAEAEVGYDYLLKILGDSLIAVRVDPTPALSLGAGYTRRVPHSYLGKQSVFARFNLEALDDYSIDAIYRPRLGLSLNGGFHVLRTFADDSVEGRLGAGWSYGKNRANRISLAYEVQSGFGDDAYAVRARWSQYVYETVVRAVFRGDYLVMNHDLPFFIQYREEERNLGAAFVGIDWALREELYLSVGGGVEWLETSERQLQGSVKLRYSFTNREEE